MTAPRNNTVAERSLLSAVLLDNDLLDQIGDLVEPEDFYDQRNGAIWSGMLSLRKKGAPIDVVTLHQELQLMKKARAAGDLAYIGSITSQWAGGTNAEQWASIISQTAKIRRLSDAAIKLVQSCQDESVALDDLETQAASLVALTESKHGSESFLRVGETWLQEFTERAARGPSIPGATTGFEEIDRLIGGLSPKHLNVIGAVPRMGKTALAAQMAVATAMAGNPVLFVSLEMPNTEIFERLVSSEARILANDLRFSRIRGDMMNKIESCVSQFSGLPIWMLDVETSTPSKVRAEVSRLKAKVSREYETDKHFVVIIDYVQILEADSQYMKENRAIQIQEMCKALKGMAKTLNVCVICLAQILRSAENQDDKRPSLRHLKDSGGIAQYADKVCFLYRDEIYNKDTPDKGVAEFIVEKQRQGETGTVRLRFVGEYVRFENLADALGPSDDAPPPPAQTITELDSFSSLDV